MTDSMPSLPPTQLILPPLELLVFITIIMHFISLPLFYCNHTKRVLTVPFLLLVCTIFHTFWLIHCMWALPKPVEVGGTRLSGMSIALHLLFTVTNSGAQMCSSMTMPLSTTQGHIKRGFSKVGLEAIRWPAQNLNPNPV